MQWPSTSRAEDAAVLALADLTRAAGGTAYRVIGGNMVTFHSARREVHIAPRSTDDADAGIESNAVTADDLVSALLRAGYTKIDGSRFTRREGELELIIDLLVSDVHAVRHNIEVGSLSADAAPGLALALARDPMWVECTVILTAGEVVDLKLPLPDSSAAVVMKTLTWATRYEDKDALDTFRLARLLVTRRHGRRGLAAPPWIYRRPRAEGPRGQLLCAQGQGSPPARKLPDRWAEIRGPVHRIGTRSRQRRAGRLIRPQFALESLMSN